MPPSSRTTPAVLVVSHDPGVRAAVLGGGTAPWAPAGAREAASAGEAVLTTRSDGAGDLAVVDLALPDPLVTALVGLLRADGWAHVMVVVPRDGADAALAAVAAGAVGVLVSTADRVGAVVATPAGCGADAPAPTPQEGTGARLTARETRLLALVAGGDGNRAIAAQLGVSPLTVKAQLARVGQKLGVGDRAAMVAVALRCGLIG